MKTMEEADGAVEVTDPIEEANASMEFEEEEEPESPELNVGRIFLGISFDWCLIKWGKLFINC